MHVLYNKLNYSYVQSTYIGLDSVASIYFNDILIAEQTDNMFVRHTIPLNKESTLVAPGGKNKLSISFESPVTFLVLPKPIVFDTRNVIQLAHYLVAVFIDIWRWHLNVLLTPW